MKYRIERFQFKIYVAIKNDDSETYANMRYYKFSAQFS